MGIEVLPAKVCICCCLVEREAGSCEPSLGEHPPTGLGAQAGATEPTGPTAPQVQGQHGSRAVIPEVSKVVECG